MPITKSVLTSYGYKARDEYAILGSLDLDGQNVYGCCIDISRYIAGELQTDIDEDMFEKVRCDINGEEMHYFVKVHVSCVSDCSYTDGYLFVDASIDQFCKEQKEIGRVTVSLDSYDELERVALVPPDDPRRNRYENCITGV